MSDTKKSHEVLAEKRLETEQAFPQYKPHEVKKGAVLPGQVYEKYEWKDPLSYEEWMKEAPYMKEHPHHYRFNPHSDMAAELRRRDENWNLQDEIQKWNEGGWKKHLEHRVIREQQQRLYQRYRDKHEGPPADRTPTIEREPPDPSKLLS